MLEMSSCEDEAKNPERYAGSRGSAPDDPCTFRVTVHFLACCTAVFLCITVGFHFLLVSRSSCEEACDSPLLSRPCKDCSQPGVLKMTSLVPSTAPPM